MSSIRPSSVGMTGFDGSTIDYTAPKGAVWVCGCCGRYSFHRDRESRACAGWDESCFIHAQLCYLDSLEFNGHGLVKYAKSAE